MISDDRLERRSEMVFSTNKLYCGDGVIPALYIAALVDEAQASINQHKGMKHALIRVTIEIEPYAQPGSLDHA